MSRVDLKDKDFANTSDLPVVWVSNTFEDNPYAAEPWLCLDVSVKGGSNHVHLNTSGAQRLRDELDRFIGTTPTDAGLPTLEELATEILLLNDRIINLEHPLARTRA